MIKRILVEKKSGFDVVAQKLKGDLKNRLKLSVDDVRIFIRYDVEGLYGADFDTAVKTIFSEPPVDNVYLEELPVLSGYEIAAVEYLPGQYDQRADSAGQCVQLLTAASRPAIRCATVYAFLTDKQNMPRIMKFLVNPVESRIATLEKFTTLETPAEDIDPEQSVSGFTGFSLDKLQQYHKSHGFAMSVNDLKLLQDYFTNEGRDPNFIELKVADTYWSDHCRHTTFLTRLTDIRIESENPHIAAALKNYKELHKKHFAGRADKYHCLMDIATIAVRELKSKGLLDNLDASDEINACSIKVKADVDGEEQDWLVMFKNETHNHPTEIEPFGGAATCLGGAIRDPLSGRSYVYQAMRVTGSGDPRTPYDETLKGKLAQATITKVAAAGFSSYGNQIGLATGIVHEMYHPGYVAKRLETGFVVGAAPAKNVVRKRPEPGDAVILIGGATGRDGCGGATGSSKAHDASSVEKCGAEVQKGNPPTERKIQRLFRRPEFTHMIKKCNDFGAGGVCVAIGELADGLEIYLDKVPKKYEGLTALELAISESQERMAIVVSASDVDKIKNYAGEENLDATHVATVTKERRMKMFFGGTTVLDMSRDLLDSNGAAAYAEATVTDKVTDYCAVPHASVNNHLKTGAYGKALLSELSRLNVCSTKGLSEMFDSTIGSGTVLMPFGGDTQLTPAIAMAAKLPVAGETDTVTVSSFGCDPHHLSESPFLGAVYSVVSSVAKAVAAGAEYDSIRLTFQEFFMRLNVDPKRWGVPLSALLGALEAQLSLGLGAIGGKDSMSGSFENIDVPPTLISFALGMAKASKVITNVLTKPGQKLYLIKQSRDKFGMPDLERFKSLMRVLTKEIDEGRIDFATVAEQGGVYSAAVKSVLGTDGLGLKLYITDSYMFAPAYGDIIISCNDIDAFTQFKPELLAETVKDGNIAIGGETIAVAECVKAFTGTLEEIFPSLRKIEGKAKTATAAESKYPVCRVKTPKPRVLLPVFPGTNCEYDTMRQFVLAGAEAETFVVKNLKPSDVSESVAALARIIDNSQILAFSGGFSGGDEPDGSGKLIATTFRNPIIMQAIERLQKRDGLIIGICNGFQVLVKLGLLPFGRITPMDENSATLTFNSINRHVSTISDVRIASVKSPWLEGLKAGDIFAVPVSHGEGRFVCPEEVMDRIIESGQIFTQYVDPSGAATMVSPYNPNGSMNAIEGILSPDGKILGKMGHAERVGKNLIKNIFKQSDMKLFERGVKYFK